MNNHDCNKVGFDNKADAVEFARMIKSEGKSNKLSKVPNSKKRKSKARFYLCGRCRQWHSTTLSKSEIKRIRVFSK